ncbi:uncharacterized protein METZ01_LOCUS269893 [marine metagenome]|uniref:Uncharacterized protein n=1 Tax=marine metagenome TaxID=408172 RepID=A0A382JYZ7_9ZZZZ
MGFGQNMVKPKLNFFNETWIYK